MEKRAGGGGGKRTQGEIGRWRKGMGGRRGRRRQVEVTGKLDMAMNHSGEQMDGDMKG
jgi:hypothetical protein